MIHPCGLPESPHLAGCCGQCNWFSKGRCLAMAPEGEHGPAVLAQSPACVAFEVFDCDHCGACCREAFDSVPVYDHDVRTLRQAGRFVQVAEDGWRDLKRRDVEGGTQCACLTGNGSSEPFRCLIYAYRPSNCAELALGSSGCLFARRRVGLSEDFRTARSSDKMRLRGDG